MLTHLPIMSKRRVSYFYDADIGCYSYGLGHPMKPFRMRLTHNLVSAYGMLSKMDVIKPTRATPLQMTRFHTDEYIDFLNRVSPETAQAMSGGGSRCKHTQLPPGSHNALLTAQS